MIYKNTSVNVVIAKIYRDFKPNGDDWVYDAMEWIGEAIEYIGAYTEMVLKPFSVRILQNKGLLPCNIELIEGIEYNGCVLPVSGATNIIKGHLKLPISTQHSCKLNPNYIHTTFEKGTVTIHCYSLPLDDKGLPLIPDSMEYREALSWYVLYRLVARGEKHPIYKDPEMLNQKWELWSVRAKNSAYLMDIPSMEKFKDSWCNIILDVNKYKKLFNTYSQTGGNGNIPGTKSTNDLTIIRE